MPIYKVHSGHTFAHVPTFQWIRAVLSGGQNDVVSRDLKTTTQLVSRSVEKQVTFLTKLK